MTFYNKNSTTATVTEGSAVEADYAARTNGIIYILDKTGGRYIAFKAFLNSFKLNITPNVELSESIFVIDPFVSRGQSMFSYSVSLDVPAQSPKEAYSNLAKIQELFRYVGTLGIVGNARDNVDMSKFDKASEFVVYFSNLINKCPRKPPPVFPFDGSNNTLKIIEDNGISGVIKKVEYKPSMDTGFFENDENFPFPSESTSAGLEEVIMSDTFTAHLPKHYTLDFELFMMNSHESLGPYWPFFMDIRG